MNNPTKKMTKPRTGAGSLQRRRDRYTEKMNQVHGVRGYGSMREAMDAKYGYVVAPVLDPSVKVACLTNHLIEQYSHYTVDEIRSITAQAMVDPSHPILQKYWQEIESNGSRPFTFDSENAELSVTSVDSESSTSQEVKVESQTDEIVVEEKSFLNDKESAASHDDGDLTVLNSDDSDSCDSFASANEANEFTSICAEIHQDDMEQASDFSDRKVFLRAQPIRPPRSKRPVPPIGGEVHVSVADVLVQDVMRRVANTSASAFALTVHDPQTVTLSNRYSVLYGRSTCLPQRTLRWCVLVATMVSVITGGLCSLM